VKSDTPNLAYLRSSSRGLDLADRDIHLLPRSSHLGRNETAPANRKVQSERLSASRRPPFVRRDHSDRSLEEAHVRTSQSPQG